MVTRATILAVIILLLPATALAQITGAEIYLDDRPLNFLPENPTQVDIRVTTTSSAYVQATQVGQATSATRQEQGVGGTRTIKYTLQPEENVRFVIEQPQLGPDARYVLEKTLPRDEQAPIIERIQINDCEENCYYSQASTARIIIQDLGPSGVAPNTISATFRGIELELTCEHEETRSICEGTIEGQGSGELEVQVRDRAGNQGEPESLQLTYDNTPPVITHTPEFIQIYGESGDVEAIPGGVPAIIEVRVREQEQPTIQLLNAYTNQEGECEAVEETGYNFVCTASFTPPNQNLAQEQINITITDPAGNQQNRTHTFRVMESDQETTPEFFSASAQALRKIDHETWAVNNITIPITVQLNKLIQATPNPLHVELQDCDVKGAGVTAGSGKIRNSNLGARSIQFEIEIERQEERAIRHDSELLNNPEINCEADLYSSLVGVAYTNPQRISFTIEPEFITALPPPREALLKQEQKAQERVTQIGESYQRLRQLTDLIQGVCRPTQLLDTSGAALSGAAVPLYATMFMRPAADGLNQAGGAMTDAAEGILNFIGPACDALQCKVDGDSSWFPSIGGIDDAFVTLSGADSREQLLDPYKSIVTAAATRCLPAVMYHYEQFRIIGCQEYECRQQVSAGLTSADACAFGAREATCNLVGGHLIHAIPAANILSSGLDYYAAAVSSPLAFVGAFSTIACRSAALGEATAVCRASAAGSRAGRLAGVVSSIDNYISELDNFGQSRDNFCSSIQSSISRIDNRPFSLTNGATNNCRGAYSTYEHNGNKYVTMNGETCAVTETRVEESASDPNEAAYAGISGMDINCRVLPENTPLSTIQDEHTTCIEDGFVADFSQLASGQEAIQKYDELQQSKEQREELEERYDRLVTDRNTLEQLQDSYLQGYNLASLQDSPVNTMQYWDDGELKFINRAELPTRDQILQDDLTDEQRTFLNTYLGEEQIDSARQTQTRIAEIDEDLVDVEEQRSLSRAQINELEKEARRAARAARTEAYQAGLQSGGAGLLKGMLGSMAGYGQLGATLDRTFGIGIADTGVGGAFADTSRFIASISDRGADLVGNQICSVAGNNRPVQEATIQTRDSRPVAHINGIRSSIGNRNNYRIDVGLAATGVSGEVQVQLRSGSNHQLVETLQLASRNSRVGRDAIGHTDEDTYTHACLVFDQPVREIFGETQVRRQNNQQVICARLQENIP